jgi:hypothetical protein
VGKQATSGARRSVAREGTARHARVPPVRYLDKLATPLEQGVPLARRSGVPFPCRLTFQPLAALLDRLADLERIDIAIGECNFVENFVPEENARSFNGRCPSRCKQLPNGLETG